MRKIQKILLGSFLTGVLICGVGAGTAIGEYSSLTYLGERTLGEENLVTENFDYTFDPELGAIRLHPSWYGGRETAEVQTDDLVPENVIRYEITYLPETIEPELIFRPGKAEEIFSEEIVAEESEAGETGSEASGTEESEVGETEREAFETKETEAGEEKAPSESRDGNSGRLTPQIQGDLLLETWYQGDMGIWMEAKDQILADLKNGKIAGYQVPHIKEITIKVNPATAPYVIFDFQE